MKQLITLIAIIAISFMASAQNKPLVTLSHEGQLTFFDSVSAFEDAVEAAVHGDIIYLSEGNFGSSKQSMTISDKKISIIGCGYNSHIIPDITFEFTSATTLSDPLLDGVRLEKIHFVTNSSSEPLEQVEIKKCKIAEFIVSSYINNILLDRCYIESFSGSSNKNIQLYNCKINKFNGNYCELVNNCNIYNYNSSASYVTNSIVRDVNNNLSSGILENCIVFGGKIHDTALRNCYDLTNIVQNVLDDNLECTIEDMSPYVGTDGTVVGIYGGEWMPFSETPSVPTVDSSKSSVVYDKENNKLNVTITVATN